MKRAYKLEIKPTDRQSEKLIRTFGVCRYVYNMYIATNRFNYEEGRNYQKNIVNVLVKTKPTFITLEDLNVRGMMKNRHLSKAIAKQGFFHFRTKLQMKCEDYGIELRLVNRFYPSSKLCSCCGHKKVDLTLKDRIYECVNCHQVLDRDLNAAMNLKQATQYELLVSV